MSNARPWFGNLLENRQVVPRWRSPSVAAETGDRSDVFADPVPIRHPERWLNFATQKARSSEDDHARVELQEVAFMVGGNADSRFPPSKGLSRLQSAWARAESSIDAWPPPSSGIGDPQWLTEERAKVGRLRAALREYPDQALLWSELARSHLILGQGEKSEKAMSCAIQLEKRNSYLRRSAARMHLSLGDPDMALAVIRRYQGINQDPRIISAEVAISRVANRPSKSAHLAKSMVFDAVYSPSTVSELAAAMATLEMEHGKHKLARKLFDRALVSPSDNTLAQAQWASERDARIVIPEVAWETPLSYEASALSARSRLDWDGVVSASEQWLADEPFAIRPAGLGSFACFTPDQVRRSASIASRALEAHPNNVMLLNNRAVSFCYLGDLDAAAQDLKSALSKQEKADFRYLVATVGLLAYRAGHRDIGRGCYSKALSAFIKDRDDREATALAVLFWLREEARYEPQEVQRVLKDLERVLARSGVLDQPEVQSMFDAVKNESVIEPLITVRDEISSVLISELEAMTSAAEERIGISRIIKEFN